MAHSYSELTKSDNTYTQVSDITPEGSVEEKSTWANFNTLAMLTWKNLSDYGKTHWCDWLYGTAWEDFWLQITTPGKVYFGLTAQDNDYVIVVTPTVTYQGVTK